AFVGTGQLAVDPDHRPVVDCAEMQLDPLALPFLWNGDGPPVPDPGVEGSVTDPAGFALEAEWHGDGAAEFAASGGPIGIQTRVGIVELELPGAIQVLPLFALELRLGKLRPGRRCPKRTGGEGEQQT